MNSLIESGMLQNIFDKHAETAKSINSILQSNGVLDVSCKTIIPKLFTIGESGVTIVRPVIEEEPVVEYVPTELE